MKMEADLLVENASQLVTLNPSPRATDPEGKLGVIPNGTLAAKDGRIVWAGPSGETSKQVSLLPQGKELDATGRIVLPGYIDSHTHLIFAGTREKEFELRLQGASYQEIAAKGGGIKSTVEKTRG
ncbi:MAG: imidazolonepropionase, partial [Deltaproteobacteria bacterium]|nr:imidazolonepropionase [Deltaproteobacteria bacterium]